MAFHPGRIVKNRGRGQKTSVNSGRVPAPVRGIDTRTPIGAMDPLNCIYAFNIVPAELGLEVRDGYREHQINIDDGATLGIRTIIVYTGLDPGVSDDKLFAVNNEGIWDVTIPGAAPTLKFTFPGQAGDAGHGVYIHYTDQSGDDFNYYADAENGLHTYTASTDTWAVAAGITGPTLANVVFIMEHKQRVWLVEENSTSAWYLPIAAIQGAATQFFFGSKMPHGGKLSALINWSVDGGVGVDDYLVAVSSAGDVLPYSGSDPSSTDDGSSVQPWSNRGTYFIGKVPKGRRFFSEYAGNLYLLSAYGLISMADLLRGVEAKDISADSLTFPIAKLIRGRLADSSDELGWEPKFLPNQGSLVISSPKDLFTGSFLQYAMSLATEGWGIWRDVEVAAFDEWKGVTYFGTPGSKVYSMDTTRDNVLLDTMAPLAEGVSIKYSLLTSYNDGGAPADFKIVQFVRPDFLAANPVSVQTKVYYDYDILEFIPTINNPATISGIWDVSLWDVALWSGGLEGQSVLQGSTGIGRTVAIALRGEAADATSLMSIDIMWTVGHPL